MFRFASLPDRIVAFHLREGLRLGTSFAFFLNGKKCGETNKSDFTFKGLDASTEYEIKIVSSFEGDVNEETHSVKTSFVKKIVDVYPADSNRLQEVINDMEDGDMLLLHKGIYEIGAIDLKPNTFIKLEEGAEIHGSKKREDYLPLIPSRFEGNEMLCYRSLINMGELDSNKAPRFHDVVLFGEGKIYGGGNVLEEDIISAHKEEFQGSDYQKNIQAGRLRGRLINVSSAKRIVIEGLTLGFSPSWNVHMIYSSDIVTANCRFESVGIHNGDGWDPDSSSHCYLFNSVFDVGDDCVAIKSGKNPDGNVIAIPSYDIQVFDCRAENGHSLAVGSEMSGGVEKVRFFDCDFMKTQFGIHIKTTRKRGGWVKDFEAENCSFSSINIRTVTYNDDGEASPELPRFENFLFKNIELDGLRHYDNGTSEDVHPIEVRGFADAPSNFKNMKFLGIKIKNAKLEQLIENAEEVKVSIEEE